MTITVNTYQSLMETLKGQVLTIPDILTLIYPDWEIVDGEEEPVLRDEMDNDFVPRWCSNPKKQNQLRKGNFSQIASYFWAGSPPERLRPLTEFIYWYFIWDDDIDCGHLADDSEGTRRYAEDSIPFIKWCLEPENYVPERTAPPTSRGNHNSGCFETIGKALQTGHSRAALRRYTDGVCDFVRAVRDAHGQRKAAFPTWDEYLANRLSTIGIYPVFMAMEFAYDITIPDWVYDHDAVQAMFREAVLSVVQFNDIASLGVEYRAGQIDSAIPVRMLQARTLSAQAVLDDMIGELQQSRRRFDAAEDALLSSPRYATLDSITRKSILVLVQGCKNVVVGHAKWTYPCQRYHLTEDPAGGKYTFTL